MTGQVLVLEARTLLSSTAAATFQFKAIASNLDTTKHLFNIPTPSASPYTQLRGGSIAMTGLEGFPASLALAGGSPSKFTLSFGSSVPGNPPALKLTSFDNGLTDGIGKQFFTKTTGNVNTMTLFLSGKAVAVGTIDTLTVLTSTGFESTGIGKFTFTQSAGTDPTVFNELLAVTGGTGKIAFHLGTFSFSGAPTGFGTDASQFASTGSFDSTMTTLAATPASAAFGQKVTFTATVAALTPATGTPTGVVTFKDGTTVLGTGTLSVVNGKAVATFSTTKLSVGSHAISAVFEGSGVLVESKSTVVTQAVVKASTTTTLKSSAATAVFGQSVTLTATLGVVSPGVGVPTGTVTFKDGATVLGTGTLSVVNGKAVATFTTSGLGIGSHSITAAYAGDASFKNSTSAAISQSIGKASTTTTLKTSLANAVFGQSVTLTATLGVVSPGSGFPTGTVTFKDGTKVLGTGTMSLVNGKVVATFVTSSLSVGTHSITAVFAGTVAFNTSTSAVLTQTIAKANTTAVVTSSVASAKAGVSVKLTATIGVVSPGVGVPTGAVVFRDGTKAIGTGTLSVVNGKVIATFSISTLTVGTHSITAAYGGDASFNLKTSAAITLTIT